MMEKSLSGKARSGASSNGQGERPRVEPVLRLFEGRRKLLVLTHTNPDPDSLASAHALRLLAREAFGLQSCFAINGRIMRAENLEMVEQLGIEMVPLESIDASGFDCVAVVDSQPGFGHTVIPDGCRVDLIVDHHEEGDEDAAKEATVREVRTDIGATSTILTHYLMAAEVEVPSDVATALAYGIRTDTADLSRNVSTWDEVAYEFLLPRIDRGSLAVITRPRLALEYFRVLRDALNNVRMFDRVMICSLGKIETPEMVAEVADLLLRHKGTDMVFAGGLVEDTYYVSVRTELGTLDAWPLLRDALDGEGTFGGHGSVAGGSVVLKDGEVRTMKRLQRRLEKNILKTMGIETVTVHELG